MTISTVFRTLFWHPVRDALSDTVLDVLPMQSRAAYPADVPLHLVADALQEWAKVFPNMLEPRLGPFACVHFVDKHDEFGDAQGEREHRMLRNRTARRPENSVWTSFEEPLRWEVV